MADGVGCCSGSGQIDLDLARASAAKALEIARAIGDELTVNRALNNLGTVLRLRGDYDGAIAALQDAVAGNREANDRGRESLSSGALSLALLARGDCSVAQAAAETSLRIATELDDVYAQGLAYGALAEVARALEDGSSARAYYNASLSRTGIVGFGQQKSSALLGLAYVDQDEGNWAAAAAHLRESVRVAHELGLRVELVEALESCSALAAVRGLAGSAVELAGATQAVRDVFRIVRWPAAQQRLDRVLVSARRKLGEADCEAALGRGRDMGLEAAVRVALLVSDAAARGTGIPIGDVRDDRPVIR